MSNKELREYKEMKNVFGDVKFSRQAWESVGKMILRAPAPKPIPMQVDKDGNPSLGSQIETYSYNQLSEDIKKLEDPELSDREPTNLEMILMCQMIKARYDTNAAVFIRDTLGAKPVDESKVSAQVNNPYESLTDEELEMLAKARAQKTLEANNNKIEGPNGETH